MSNKRLRNKQRDILCPVKMEALPSTYIQLLQKQVKSTGEIPFRFLTICRLEHILIEHHSAQTDKSNLILMYCIIHELQNLSILMRSRNTSIHVFRFNGNPYLVQAIS